MIDFKEIPYKLPVFLLCLYAILFISLAINPFGRMIWVLENIPVWFTILLLVSTFSRFQFSNTSYVLMAIFLYYHTLGAHWTFALVPFEWGNQALSVLNMDFLFSAERNNFDRFGHFLAGGFAYPLVELIWRKHWVNHIGMALLFAIFAVGFAAALYEIIETIYVVIVGGTTGAEFLGAQGDIWDAQKDILLDMLGAVLFSVFTLKARFYTGPVS